MDISYKQHSFYTSKISEIAHYFLRRLRYSHRTLNLQLRGVICHSTAKCFVYTLKGSIALSVASSWLFHNKLCSTVTWWCGVGGVCYRGDAILNMPGTILSATSLLSRGRHRELSHFIVRHPKNDNALRMSRVITLPVLIRRHGPSSS